jgi:hypothetical protein
MRIVKFRESASCFAKLGKKGFEDTKECISLTLIISKGYEFMGRCSLIPLLFLCCRLVVAAE